MRVARKKGLRNMMGFVWSGCCGGGFLAFLFFSSTSLLWF